MLTRKEQHFMAHALGMNKPDDESYRNYFASCPEDPDDLVWKDLCERGYAHQFKIPSDTFPYNGYSVTDEGKEALIASLKDSMTNV